MSTDIEYEEHLKSQLEEHWSSAWLDRMNEATAMRGRRNRVEDGPSHEGSDDEPSEEPQDGNDQEPTSSQP